MVRQFCFVLIPLYKIKSGKKKKKYDVTLQTYQGLVLQSMVYLRSLRWTGGTEDGQILY